MGKERTSLFRPIFSFFQDGTYFGETDLFLHEKHQSVIIFADLRFVFESLSFQIGLSFALVPLGNNTSQTRGKFEIMSKITPWIVRHEVQLLIYCFYKKFELKMSFKNFSAFDNFEHWRKLCEGSHNARVIDVRITWVSINKKINWSDLSITHKTDGKFGNVPPGVLFSKVAYRRKRR